VPDLMALVTGPASIPLGQDVAELLAVQQVAYDCRRFPDREAEVDIRDSVRGRDVYLLRAASPPVDQHLIELLPERRGGRSARRHRGGSRPDPIIVDDMLSTGGTIEAAVSALWIAGAIEPVTVATAIRRNHFDESLADLRVRP